MERLIQDAVEAFWKAYKLRMEYCIGYLHVSFLYSIDVARLLYSTFEAPRRTFHWECYFYIALLIFTVYMVFDRLIVLFIQLLFNS